MAANNRGEERIRFARIENQITYGLTQLKIMCWWNSFFRLVREGGEGHNGRSPAMAGLLEERGWIVRSRNSADYMDVRESVKARRRQINSIYSCKACFHAPLTYGWT